MGESLPREFGRYELLERLGRGGMAVLYKARVRGVHGFEKVVAIKRIRPSLLQDSKFVAMFIDEAKLTSHLTHPKIVQVLELGAVDGDPFIAMEFVDGLDVLALLRDCARTANRLPEALAVHIAHEVLDGLEHAHTATDERGRPLGIVHRDISPGNVLVSWRGDVKLADFGIARAFERRQKTRSGILKGKLGYMSPEHVAGQPVDARSDVFAVGILLAEMLMNKRLFVAATDLDTLLMVRDARLNRLRQHGAHIPPALCALIERGLAQRVRDRFQSAGEFRDALADYLFENGRRVQATDVAAYLQRQVGRRRAGAPDGVVENVAPDPHTLSGHETLERRLRVEESARIARRAISESGSDPREIEIPGEVPSEVPGEVSAEVTAAETRPPDERGELTDRSVIGLLYDLAHRAASGQLVVAISGIVKGVYFTEGSPQFVSSNVARERFGAYLVAEGAISEGELSMALAMLPRFENKLGDALVGLGLLTPLAALRLLTRQVRDKLVELCTWQKGEFRWFANAAPPSWTQPLHLDPYEIIGAGALALSESYLRLWVEQHTALAPVVASSRAALSVDFGLGSAVGECLRTVAAAAARTGVGELVGQYSAQARWLETARLLHLLHEVGWIRLQPLT